MCALDVTNYILKYSPLSLSQAYSLDRQSPITIYKDFMGSRSIFLKTTSSDRPCLYGALYKHYTSNCSTFHDDYSWAILVPWAGVESCSVFCQRPLRFWICNCWPINKIRFNLPFPADPSPNQKTYQGLCTISNFLPHIEIFLYF